MENSRESNCWYKETCDKDCERCVTYTQLKWQMDNSGLYPAQQVPISMILNRFNQVDKEAYNKLSRIRNGIVRFVEQHKNLYICSEQAGNGKTSWAIRMLHTYFHHCAKDNYEHLLGMFVNTTDLLLKLKDFNNPIPQRYLRDLENVDLVIFDDIAITNGISQFDYTQLFNIINKRLMAEKSNIFTSNIVDYEQLEITLGSRLASRIYNTSEIIELKGLDMR